MFSAQELIELQDRRTREWHESGQGQASVAHGDGSPGDSSSMADSSGNDRSAGDWLDRVAEQHRANFELWHIEDEARRPGTSDAQLADVKRRIDNTNQRRNDLAEQLDRFLLTWLQKRDLPNCQATLHSESPGLIVDRLSILALKIYHTREEAERPAAPEGHAARNSERLAILEEQRADLASCLDALWQETLAGTRCFKLYRQLKMYNDPALNPAIYGQNAAQTRR